MANEYINKVSLADGTTLIDLTSDTVMAADVRSGATFHLASGALATGTLSTSGVGLGTGQVTTATIGDGAVTYDKLNYTAKISPIKLITASVSLSADDLGKTLVTNSSSASIIFTVPNSTTLVEGYELAILNYLSTSTKITFASNVKAILFGNDAPVVASSFILEKYSMIALKKITTDTWLLTGAVKEG